jgi:protoheme IX farnesyltransferase
MIEIQADETVPVQVPLSSIVRDLLALTKPHIVMMSTLTAAGGAALAPTQTTGAAALWLSMACIALLVAGAGALNMVLERDLDRRMERTRDRPLAAGRIHPGSGWILGAGSAGLAILGLALLANLWTAALGALGLVVYLAVYTPLKRRTPLALFAGAVSGGLPPLMGWTAAAGAPQLPGLALFTLLFIWQVPHFLAIALFREQEYASAGFRTMVQSQGRRRTWIQLIATTGALVIASVLLIPIGLAGWLYGGLALLLGAGLLTLGVLVQAGDAGQRARVFFRATLVYLPALTLGLLVDQWL